MEGGGEEGMGNTPPDTVVGWRSLWTPRTGPTLIRERVKTR